MVDFARLEVAEHDGLVVVRIYGEIDLSNVDQIQAMLEDVLTDRPRQIVDLSHTTYFDSTGLRMLFTLAARLRSRRQELHLIAPVGTPPRRILDLTGFERIAPVHASLSEAAG